jgi:CAAD domains of cyanobacterial aminoacyl-tRNA synthetase
MDNILVELERIDHIAEIEAAKEHQLDNPIEIAQPTKPDIENFIPYEEPTAPLATDDRRVLEIELSDVAEKSADSLAETPSYLSQIYQQNRGAFINVGLFYAALITLKLMLAFVAAVDTIPLFAPFFRAIGLGYTGWFVYRYLLKAATRQELAGEIDTLKAKVIGRSARSSK